jgi:hypothetical protein
VNFQNADPDPDPASKNNADPDPQPCWRYILISVVGNFYSPLLGIQCCGSILTDSGSEFRLTKPRKSPRPTERVLSIFTYLLPFFGEFLGYLKRFGKQA